MVEIGSYHGRSAIVLALGLGGRGQVVAIDPHAGNDRGPQEIEAERSEGQADHERFNANLARAGVEDAVRHVRLPSQEALDEVEGELDLLYVDGAHRFGPRSGRHAALGRARPPGRADAGARLVLVDRRDAGHPSARWPSAGLSIRGPDRRRWRATAGRSWDRGARAQRRPPARPAAVVRAQRADQGGGGAARCGTPTGRTDPGPQRRGHAPGGQAGAHHASTATQCAASSSPA